MIWVLTVYDTKKGQKMEIEHYSTQPTYFMQDLMFDDNFSLFNFNHCMVKIQKWQYVRGWKSNFVYFVHKAEIGILRDHKTRKTITGASYGSYI